MDHIKVSVIIPSYNRENTIKRCIDSVINQTMPPFEIIVIDDGSSDGTIEIVESILWKNLNIIKQNHRGAQAARNLGIMNARGNYIAFLDSDDEWVPSMLEKEIDCLKKEDNCIVYSNCYICSEKRKKLRKLPECNNRMGLPPLMYDGPMFQSLLVKKELFSKIGFLDEKVITHQEWDATISLARVAKFVHLKEPLFIYHLHNGETISKDRNNGLRGYAYIVKKYEKETIEKGGIKTVNQHYNNLIKAYLKFDIKYAVIYVMKVLYINVTHAIKSLKKDNQWKI